LKVDQLQFIELPKLPDLKKRAGQESKCVIYISCVAHKQQYLFKKFFQRKLSLCLLYYVLEYGRVLLQVRIPNIALKGGAIVTYSPLATGLNNSNKRHMNAY